MTTPHWDDPVVAARLREVVLDLGRRAVFDPARLRAALNDSLGSAAHQYRAQVDVLAVAAEEQLPQGLVDDEDRGALRARLVSRDVQPQVADWALDAWAGALSSPPPRPLPPTALPPTALPATALPPMPPPTPTPTPPRREPPTPRPPTPLPGPAPLPQTPLPQTPQHDAARRRPSRALVLVLAVVLAALLSAGAVAGVRRFVATGAVPATTPTAQPTAEPTPGSTPTPGPSATPTPQGKPGGTVVSTTPAALSVLAHEGGSERFALETAESLVDAARRGYAAETDIRWTSDGVAVLTHDEKIVAPMDCGKAYTIADTTWATLKAKCRSVASASKDRKRYGLPRFDDVVTKVAAVPGAQLFAEVKVVQTKTQTASIADVLVQHQMVDRTVVTSFLPGELTKMRAAVKAKGGDLRLMQFVRDTDELSAAKAKKAGLWAVAVRKDAVTAGYVSSLHKAGVVVIVWTPDDELDWSTARKAGADHVLTNRPGAYLKWQKS